MKRRAQESAPEARLRRRAFYLHLPQETLRQIMARREKTAGSGAEDADAPPTKTCENSETLKSGL
jgi:hypothetical protein